jgi:hypothetical protein
MRRSLATIEDELDQLQASYIDEEDDRMQMQIVSRFSACLREASEVDGVERIAVGVTIHNWVRGEESFRLLQF